MLIIDIDQAQLARFRVWRAVVCASPSGIAIKDIATMQSDNSYWYCRGKKGGSYLVAVEGGGRTEAAIFLDTWEGPSCSWSMKLRNRSQMVMPSFRGKHHDFDHK